MRGPGPLKYPASTIISTGITNASYPSAPPAMTIVAIILLLLIGVSVLMWYSKRQNMKMQAFVARAIQKYSEEENPVALQYILIGYSTAVGPTRNQIVLEPLLMARADAADIQDQATREAVRARLGKLEETLLSREWSLRDSLRLKHQLSRDCFRAWGKFDLTIFDRI